MICVAVMDNGIRDGGNHLRLIDARLDASRDMIIVGLKAAVEPAR